MRSVYLAAADSVNRTVVPRRGGAPTRKRRRLSLSAEITGAA